MDCWTLIWKTKSEVFAFSLFIVLLLFTSGLCCFVVLHTSSTSCYQTVLVWVALNVKLSVCGNDYLQSTTNQNRHWSFCKDLVHIKCINNDQYWSLLYLSNAFLSLSFVESQCDCTVCHNCVWNILKKRQFWLH